MSAPVACRLAKADEKARVVEFLDAHWGSRHPLVHLDDFFNHYYVHDGRLQFAFAEQAGETVAVAGYILSRTSGCRSGARKRAATARALS